MSETTQLQPQVLMVQNGAGSENAEHVEIEIRSPREEALNRNNSRYTPEQLEEIRKRSREMETAKYFAIKEGNFDKAVEQCKTDLYYSELDGSYVGAWLLTEIDHWDNEKERLVLLTQKQLILVQYNFITSQITDHRKIPLVNCTRIQSSTLGYGGSAFAFYRYSTLRSDQLGIRVHWNMPKSPGMLDFWNPWSKDIPFVTLTSHTSVEVNKTSPDSVNFTTFEKSLIAAASSDVSRALATDEEPILINVIFGISAMVHNQSKLGFCRERGGVCF